MSELVNYKKRSITLPAGCKNLIDVLKPRGLAKLAHKIGAGTIPPNEVPAVRRGGSFVGGLSDIKKYVAMVFHSRARAFMLMVTPPDEQFTLDVDRMEDGTVYASVVVQTGTEQERAVRSFFAQHNLFMPDESKIPGVFVPHLPVQIVCEISPVPPDAALLSKLIADLLRDAFGLRDDSQLCFRFWELGDAP